MSSISVAGDTSGSITLQAPAVAGSSVLTLPVATDTLVGKATTDTLTNKTLTSPVIAGTPTGVGVLTSGTAVASTSDTSIDFTGIPSWAKRITVMLSGVSTSGTSGIRFQLMVGGSPVTTNYVAASVSLTTVVTASPTTVTDGFPLSIISASSVQQGQIVLSNLSSAIWTASGTFYDSLATERIAITTGRVTSVGTVDGLRVTTTGGTNTFDAGSINIMYE